MRLSLIVAVSENGVIGRTGELPWHLGADLKRFRELTTGHTIIMGRKTWESIGRPLPDRRCIVISRRPGFAAQGASTARRLDQAVELAREADESEAFVIGGAEVYREALPRVGRLYLTMVHAMPDGDVHFPPFSPDDWQLVEQRRLDADETNDHAMTFCVFDRALAAE